MRPILTIEELVRAQQKAIGIYQLHGRVGERDVYALLGLNIDRADSDHYLEDNATNWDIRSFVRNIATEHYILQRNNQQAFNILSGKTAAVGVFDENLNVKENKHMDSYAQQLVCEKAEEKLQKLYDEKGCLTRKDVLDVLGLRFPNSQNYEKQIVVDSRKGKDLSIAVKAVIKTLTDQVYLPYKLPFGLEPLKMWQTDNGYTTVQWADGTTTSVLAKDESHTTPYGGFCACVVKKLYGSTGQAIKLMQNADKNAKWPAEKKRIEREKLKKIRQANAEMRQEKEKKRREHLVEMHMEEIYAKREAERRVAEADEKEEYGL